MDIVEPAAIWSPSLVVMDSDVSLTQNALLTQGRSALYAVVTRIDKLIDAANRYPNIHGFYPDPEIPHLITEILAHQGIASLLLFNRSERDKKNESARAFELRLARHDYVLRFCDEAGFAPNLLANRTLRNKIVHMDSHLERALRTPNTGWFIDSALGRRSDLQAPEGLEVGFCRCFIGEELSIAHLGHQVSLDNLRHEACAVLALVFGVDVSTVKAAR